ncbi:MAG: ImmA/IrrE family metallo-endopeptidase [Thermoleophilaceae bacterium]|nr:ImmA/IrrE family metallo-endopeptidase [Thermoleophilaceae bacterium]
MKLEIDPVRVRALRHRIEMPVQRAAELSGLDPALIEHLEADRDVVEVDVVRRLAKAYNRNWYVFLLDDEPGAPALPRDLRRLSRGAATSDETLIAFDDAELLIDKILDLPRESDVPPMTLSNIAGMTADDAAQLIRDELGATLEAQRQHAAEYDAVRYWSALLTKAGFYAGQLSFPYREVRAFCLRRDGVSLIVVSSRDSPRARVFSMLHELGHLLLGGEAMCQPRSDETSQSALAEEPFCNAFAAAVLMPADEFASDPAALALRGKSLNLGDAVQLARRFGVSELAALRRLATVGVISQEEYERLHRERDEDFSDEPEPSTRPRIRKQATRMINENSRLYATEVLDAHARGDISLREIGVLLGGNLKHVQAIREELRR